MKNSWWDLLKKTVERVRSYFIRVRRHFEVELRIILIDFKDALKRDIKQIKHDLIHFCWDNLIHFSWDIKRFLCLWKQRILCFWYKIEEILYQIYQNRKRLYPLSILLVLISRQKVRVFCSKIGQILYEIEILYHTPEILYHNPKIWYQNPAGFSDVLIFLVLRIVLNILLFYNIMVFLILLSRLIREIIIFFRRK